MMRAAPSYRTDATRPARVRHLLATARGQQEVERFWTLAVTMQLIEDHVADLDRRAAQARCPVRRGRLRRAGRAWEARLAAVRALLPR